MSTPDPANTKPPSEPKTPARVGTRQFLQLFSAVLLPMFMAAADQTLLATSTPVIAAEFGQLHDTAWLATAYLLTNACMIPVYGRLGDRYGRREVLFVAMGIFVLGSLACAIIFGLLPDMSLAELLDESEMLADEAVLRVFHIQFAFFAVASALAALNARRVPRVKIT